MTMYVPSLFFTASVLALTFHVEPACAQSRVFVAAQGSDANPCTFALPCRTFQHAHDVVAAKGEIDVLDPAGYGSLTITKAISIQGHGFAGLAVTSGDGITISAGGNDKISLRGLLLDGVGAGSNGITFNTGAMLDIQDCLIRNFGTHGIAFAPTSLTSILLMSDTHVAANGGTGILVTASPGTFLTGSLERVISVNGNSGFILDGNTSTSRFAISDSVMSHHTNGGVIARGLSGGQAEVMVSRSTISHNEVVGLSSNGNSSGAPVIRVTKSTITANLTGFQPINGGNLISFGDNSLGGNTVDGAPTGTVPLQ